VITLQLQGKTATKSIPFSVKDQVITDIEFTYEPSSNTDNVQSNYNGRTLLKTALLTNYTNDDELRDFASFKVTLKNALGEVANEAAYQYVVDEYNNGGTGTSIRTNSDYFKVHSVNLLNDEQTGEPFLQVNIGVNGRCRLGVKYDNLALTIQTDYLDYNITATSEKFGVETSQL